MSGDRILVVQVAGIGDAAMASTIVERLRSEQPGTRITWVCGTAAAPLIDLYDGVSETIAVDHHALVRGSPLARSRAIVSLWLTLLRRGGFRQALVLHVDPRYRVLVAPLVRTPKAFLSRARHGAMIPVPGRFQGDEYARLVGGTAHTGPIECRYEMIDLRPKFPSTARLGQRVILAPGGARNALREDALRRWPVDHYARVAHDLLAAGAEVVLVGNDQDAWVRSAFNGLAVSDRIGGLSLVETLALMRDSDLVISHDTGPMHLARLVRAPLVALFGPTNPGQFLSLDDTITVLWGGASLACRPCYDGREFARCSANICLSRVTPEQVVQVAHDRLARRTGPTRASPAPQTPGESALR
jgi:heptosyltransferase II